MIIKRFLFICLFVFFLVFVADNTLMAVDTGAYLSPKFLFEIQDSAFKNSEGKNINNLYFGGGASIGYNFYKLYDFVPLRIELEYLYRNGIGINKYNPLGKEPNITNVINMNSHTILTGIYYDFYLFLPNKNANLEEGTSDRKEFMSIYLGMLLGGAIENQVTKAEMDTTANNQYFTTYSEYVQSSKFLFGFGFGFNFYLNEIISLDIGYRSIFDTDFNAKHNIITALRFNF